MLAGPTLGADPDEDAADEGEQADGSRMGKLVKQLRSELSGTFLKAVVAWIESPKIGIDENPALEGPSRLSSRGAEIASVPHVAT